MYEVQGIRYFTKKIGDWMLVTTVFNQKYGEVTCYSCYKGNSKNQKKYNYR